MLQIFVDLADERLPAKAQPGPMICLVVDFTIGLPLTKLRLERCGLLLCPLRSNMPAPAWFCR